MLRGCPQGSSFGPLLWNLCQNDMADQVENTDVPMYADNHQFYCMGKDFDVAKHILEQEGERTAEWYRNNYLLENPEKYQSLIINPRNLNTSAGCLDIIIKGKVIENANQIKLLGVNVDGNMNFAAHISEMCKRASRKVGVLMRLRNLIPVADKLMIYKTSILPHLTYCQLVWHFCKSSDSRKVERVQERALRAVYRNRIDSYENLLERAQLPTLLNRCLQDIAMLMYRVKNDLLPSSVTDIFSIKDSNYSLRNSDFSIPRVNTEKYGKHSLHYFGPFLWSKLPADLRTAPSLSSFKNRIRTMDIHGVVNSSRLYLDKCHQLVCEKLNKLDILIKIIIIIILLLVVIL